MEYMRQKVIDALCSSSDGFITPNEEVLYNENIVSLFAAIGRLELEGIIRRRNCDGLAYEFAPGSRNSVHYMV